MNIIFIDIVSQHCYVSQSEEGETKELFIKMYFIPKNRTLLFIVNNSLCENLICKTMMPCKTKDVPLFYMASSHDISLKP